MGLIFGNPVRTTIQWGFWILGMPKRFLECPNSPNRRSCVSSLLKSPGPGTPTSRCERRLQHDSSHFQPILWHEKFKSSNRVVWIRSNGEIMKGKIIIISTKYLAPSTWYQVLVPGTKYLVPSSWYQVLGSKYLVPSTWYQVLVTKYLVPSTWYQVLGTKYLVPSMWY